MDSVAVTCLYPKRVHAESSQFFLSLTLRPSKHHNFVSDETRSGDVRKRRLRSIYDDVSQGRPSADSRFQLVSGVHRAHARRRAGENDVAR